MRDAGAVTPGAQVCHSGHHHADSAYRVVAAMSDSSASLFWWRRAPRHHQRWCACTLSVHQWSAGVTGSRRRPGAGTACQARAVQDASRPCELRGRHNTSAMAREAQPSAHVSERDRSGCRLSAQINHADREDRRNTRAQRSRSRSESAFDLAGGLNGSRCLRVARSATACGDASRLKNASMAGTPPQRPARSCAVSGHRLQDISAREGRPGARQIDQRASNGGISRIDSTARVHHRGAPPAASHHQQGSDRGAPGCGAGCRPA